MSDGFSTWSERIVGIAQAATLLLVANMRLWFRRGK